MTCSVIKKELALLPMLFAMLLALCTSGYAQQPAPLPQASPAASPAEGETARPLYGLQGVLIETLDGKVVSSQGENEQFNPATNLKLATALVALSTVGPE